VEANARAIAAALAKSKRLPLRTEFKALLTTPDEITQLMLEANRDPDCAGLVLWMHTFSPSKMWIRGLTALAKPFLHLHTQFNRDLPRNPSVHLYAPAANDERRLLAVARSVLSILPRRPLRSAMTSPMYCSGATISILMIGSLR